MTRLFGTDGVRGLANEVITADLAVQLGEAAGRRLGEAARANGKKPRAVIGRDTRVSGEFLDCALAAGLASAGVDVVRIGVVATPTVAFLAAADKDIDLGVMISASHNPMPDNGIKFFASGGYKLDDSIEDEIEALLGSDWDRPTGADVGEIWDESELAEKAYVDHLVGACTTRLDGLKIAVDCANGGGSFLGPEALREAGAEVIVINASPDGRNINDNCGSTHPEQLQAITVSAGADFGVAYDGDADRCLAVDGEGNLVDGDQIMGALAMDLHRKGKLRQDTLVVTVMSNLGMLLAMKAAGITTVQTGVGDRYVLEAMLEGDYTLGGEQSGHVIASEHATTGDGILTSLLLANLVKESGLTLNNLVAGIPRLPQILINVSGVDRTGVNHPGLQEEVLRVEQELGETGRVLLRSSGTEPVVRVMVEAPTEQQAEEAANRLAAAVKEHISL